MNHYTTTTIGPGLFVKDTDLDPCYSEQKAGPGRGLATAWPRTVTGQKAKCEAKPAAHLALLWR